MNKLLVPVDPAQNKRTRSFLQIVADILNALILSGTITQTGQGEWQVPSNTVQNILGIQVYGRHDAQTNTLSSASGSTVLENQIFGG